MYQINLSVGVLAAMWPCGVIVYLSELFISESKLQVYATIHEFLFKYSSISDKLSESYKLMILNVQAKQLCMPVLHTEYICYDDGCHLCKYARHPSRKDLYNCYYKEISCR